MRPPLSPLSSATLTWGTDHESVVEVKRQRSSEFGFSPSWCSPYTWGTLFRQLFAEIMFRTFGRASDCFVPFSAFAVRGSELSDHTYNFYEYMNEDANATDYVSGQSTFWLSWSSFVVTFVSRATFLLLLLSLLLLVLIWLPQISARRLALCIIHVFLFSFSSPQYWSTE